MNSWLKFFGLSFFSDKIAKEARTRGVFNCVLGFIFALLFIFCGVLAANAIPFYNHYDGATDFKDFVSNFVDGAALTVSESRLSSDAVINTYTDEAAAGKYLTNGYNLVIDTRPSTALDDFGAYCLAKDGTEISYEAYLALSDEEKSGYTFKIRYTDKELILTDSLIAGYKEYLGASTDEGIKKEYADLAEQKDSLADNEYKNKVYALYLKAYYSDVSAFENVNNIPLLRNYYYFNYLGKADTEKCLFIFEDRLFGSFYTDGGVKVTFSGAYNGLSDGGVTDGDGFIKSAFKSSVAVSANVYLINLFKFIPLIALIPLVLALICKIAFTVIKDEKFKKYGTCLKVEFSYIAVAGLITAVLHFICGYFVSSGILNSLPIIFLAAVMAVRTLVFVIGEYFAIKKINARKAEEAAEAENM